MSHKSITPDFLHDGNQGLYFIHDRERFYLHNRHFCAIIGKKEGEFLLSLNHPRENTAAMVNFFACRKLRSLEETEFYQPIVVAKE